MNPGWPLTASSPGRDTLRSSLMALLMPAPLPRPRSKLDPPANYFRIRLVCGLLGVCGQYFTRGAARRKLDRFLPYLQRYLLAKPPLPLDVEFDVQVAGALRLHAGCALVWAVLVGEAADAVGQQGLAGAGLELAAGQMCLLSSAPAVPEPEHTSPPHLLLQDLWDHLKITPPQYETYEAACAAVAEIEAAEAAAAASGLEAIEEEDEEEEAEGPEDGGSDAGSDGDDDEEEDGDADEEEDG